VSRANTRTMTASDLLLGAIVVIAVVGLATTPVVWPHLQATDSYPLPALPLAAVVYGWLGWLILRRERNTIGWILLGEGAGLALICVTSEYAVIGVAHAGLLPVPRFVGALSEWLFFPVVLALAFMLMLFPTGTLPSARWRWFAVATGVVTGLTFASAIVTPRQVALPAPGGVSLRYPNPFALEAFRFDPLGTLTGLGVFSAALLAVGAVALAGRYRRGDPVLCQQIKWIAFVAGLFVLAQVALAISFVAVGSDARLSELIGLASAALALLGFPVAITIAILKYGLFQIDVLINRAVVYGLLAAVLTGIYVAIVAGVGALAGYGGGPLLTVAAAVAIAIVFQPLRHRAQMVANRIVYGDRATPYQVLSEFADAMERTLPLEEQLDRMVSLLASGTAADHVEVWIRVADVMQAAAAWPRDAAPRARGPDQAFDDATGVFPVRHGDEPLGAIVVYKPRNEQLSPAETGLAEHVASQAGLVVRNVRLTAELQHSIDQLRASRRRLVEAQDTERRKIERNLHDGAQQQLVALGVQLSLLERMAGGEDGTEKVVTALPGLRQLLGDALDDLRDLARGIYPPLLADQGLGAAIGAQARKAAVETSVESDGIGRYDQQVEAAVYFCTLEALQNIAKYADASHAVVRLRATDGQLSFEVRDDGRGFEPGAAHGSGLQGMADRLDAMGGRLEIESRPGSGTVVRGVIDVARSEQST
jgi:signal transduction histidine kinase